MCHALCKCVADQNMLDMRLFLLPHARTHTASVGNADFSIQDTVLRDVTDAQMRERPHPKLNSLAWLFWHLSRVEDIAMNLIIAERAQVLDTGDWAARFNVSRLDAATSMNDEEVSEFTAQINLSEMFAYRQAVGRQTIEIVRALQPDALDAVIDEKVLQRVRDAGVLAPNAEWVYKRWMGRPKTFTLTHSVLAHSLQHLGQADIIRGLLGLPTV